MTNEQMRIAIAECMGWKWYRRPATGPWAAKPMRTLYLPALVPETVANLHLADMTERECNSAFIFREGLIPNYPMELNACAEMQKSIKGLADQLQYLSFLSPIRSEWTLATATPFERCVAFLKLQNLWQEEPK